VSLLLTKIISGLLRQSSS